MVLLLDGMFGVDATGRYVNQTALNHAIDTYEPLDNIEAQVTMLMCYLKDTNLSSNSDFIAVGTTIEDNVVATSRVARLMDTFFDERIHELTGYTFSEFLELPVYFTKQLVKRCKKINAKERKMLDGVDSSIEQKIKGLKR